MEQFSIRNRKRASRCEKIYPTAVEIRPLKRQIAVKCYFKFEKPIGQKGCSRSVASLFRWYVPAAMADRSTRMGPLSHFVVPGSIASSSGAACDPLAWNVWLCRVRESSLGSITHVWFIIRYIYTKYDQVNFIQ